MPEGVDFKYLISLSESIAEKSDKLRENWYVVEEFIQKLAEKTGSYAELKLYEDGDGDEVLLRFTKNNVFEEGRARYDVQYASRKTLLAATLKLNEFFNAVIEVLEKTDAELSCAIDVLEEIIRNIPKL